MKTLVIVPKKNMYYFDSINDSEICIEELFNSGGSILCRWLRKMNSSLTRFFYNKWYINIESYDRIVVMDVALMMDSSLLKNISRTAPNADKFVYSWNIVKNDDVFLKQLNEVKRFGFKFYSYDKNDCSRLGIEFNTIMYDPNVTNEDMPITWDVVFLGFVKDRKEQLLSLYNAFRSFNMNPLFTIVDKNGEYSNLPFRINDSYVSYSDYLDMVRRSRAILDITQKGQDGFSMRVMEAIFLGKKLISTNKALVDADFYDSNNILIVESDNIDPIVLKEFMNADFHPYPKEIKDYYSIRSWVNRFKIDGRR